MGTLQRPTKAASAPARAVALAVATSKKRSAFCSKRSLTLWMSITTTPSTTVTKLPHHPPPPPPLPSPRHLPPKPSPGRLPMTTRKSNPRLPSPARRVGSPCRRTRARSGLVIPHPCLSLPRQLLLLLLLAVTGWGFTLMVVEWRVSLISLFLGL